MKKNLFLACLLSFVFTNAQDQNQKMTIDKGTWFLGGNASFSFADRESESGEFNSEIDVSAFNLSPSVGYTFSNNWVAGLGLRYGYSKQENEAFSGIINTAETTTRSLGFFPFVRGYKGIGEKLSLYLQGELSYSKLWSETDSSQSTPIERDQNTFFVGIRPGITYFVSNKLALEASLGALGYTRTKGEVEGNSQDDFTERSFDFSFNTSNLLFGLAYYF